MTPDPEYVDLRRLRPGPIRNESLSPELLDRIKAVFDVIGPYINMTLEQFTDDCDARRGKVELHSHCGGVNSCKGFSYDEDTDVLTEHTCKGANTCAGYSCVIG